MIQRIAHLNWFQVFAGLCCCAVVAACSPAPTVSAPATREAMPDSTSTIEVQIPEPTLNFTALPTPTHSPAPTAALTPTGTPLPVEPADGALPDVPSPGQISGIEINPGQAEIELPWVQQAGAAWVRVNALRWSDVEQVEGQRNWSAIAPLEELMVSASEQGFQTIMIVRSTPSWARKVPGSACGPIRADKFQAFADFMTDLVNRYSVPPYNVSYWEIWNEPDIDPSSVKSDSIFGCWGDKSDLFNGGQFYGNLLKAIYPQIKSAKQDVKIMVGGLLLDCDPIHPPEWPPNSGQIKDCTAARFLEGVLESGAGDSFDAISFHAYDYYGEKLGAYGNLNWNSTWETTGPVVIAKVAYVQGLLERLGLKKELFNTENAMICGSSQAICSTEEFELTKAYYAAFSMGAARMLGLNANVWYSTTGWRSSGLFGASYQPLPVYESYRFSIQVLDQAAFRRVIDDYPGLSGYEFERDGTRIWLIWSLEGAGKTIRLPELPEAVFDVFGTSQPPAQDLTVTLAPIYLEWAK
jgi:hypothetical protein